MENPDSHRPFPLAMPAPAEPVVEITPLLIQQAVEGSRQSPRRRIILPFHKSATAPLHRMLNAIQPGSFVQPHRHAHPPKDEAILLLQGVLGTVIFDDAGHPERFIVLGGQSGCVGVDIVAGVFHTFIALAPDTVLFEAKPGPYERSVDKDFAPWAPTEGTPAAPAYLEALVARLRAGGANWRAA